ncbi:hypothetical protein BYT27DRAFT_7102891 [Phlegmacium glaucopus]|nr:hypothetical protein BYT27DRAFT_7102891 [Phlegmacium glaucopus]
MLKAHQACIDLEKGVLRIQGREVRFLSEHELPEKARDRQLEPEELAELLASAGGPSTAAPASAQPRLPSFPGGGQTIGTSPAAPAAPAPPVQRPSRAPAAGSRHSEQKIQVLMDLGATREIAIRTLDAADGNVDVAASLLF